ncbi:hypothetical protein [Variovorax jilinensis]|uniref:hypothetical protein n=1 Tax=Variovorax jilinensis TaxID=3053513 RepID=UPI002577F847|nr:hypothetical protein [Variovorax sp. J22P168]
MDNVHIRCAASRRRRLVKSLLPWPEKMFPEALVNDVMLVKMYYMNTERDNFHDWARDKPDSTSFSGLHRSEVNQFKAQPVIRWGRIGFWIVLAVVAGIAVRYFVKL